MSAGWGSFLLLQKEAMAVRAQADRAMALQAALSVLEEVRSGGALVAGERDWPTPGVRGLKEGKATLRLSPRQPGLWEVEAEVSWKGVDGKEARLALTSLLREAGR
jgi:hypothetical protein